MKTRTYIIVLFAVIILSGCSQWWYQDIGTANRNYGEIKFHLLTIGGNKAQVEQAIGSPKQVVAATEYRGHVLEVWLYEQWKAGIGADYVEEQYYVYFIDGALRRWGRPGDWKEVADQILEVRIR